MTFHLPHRLFCLVSTFAAALPIFGAGAEELASVARQTTRPVLIRNEHNSLLQLRVECKEPDVELKSIAVVLEGTGAMESLQFYFAGDAAQLPTEKPFGERRLARETIAFRGHARLNAGVHLDCQFLADGRPETSSEIGPNRSRSGLGQRLESSANSHERARRDPLCE
jgi:hypothetical protein